MSGSISVISVDEEADEVALCALLLGTSVSHGLDKSHVGLVVGEVLNDIRHADLEDNVHTAFQVQTETDLCLKTFLVAVDAQILHRILVILLGDGILQLGSLLVVVMRGDRE